MYILKKTSLLIPVFLLLSTHTSKVQSFHFNEMFEDFDRAFQHMRHEFNHRFYPSQKLNAEEQELVNKQLEAINAIKPEVTKDANGLVSIVFPIENINKEKIELSLEHGLLNGVIPVENGYFRFIVYPKFIRCEYVLNITKQVTIEAPKDETIDTSSKENAQEKEEKAPSYQTFSWKANNAFSEGLPLEVDLTKAQSETKNNKLIIKIEPKSYTRLKIRHS